MSRDLAILKDRQDMLFKKQDILQCTLAGEVTARVIQTPSSLSTLSVLARCPMPNTPPFGSPPFGGYVPSRVHPVNQGQYYPTYTPRQSFDSFSMDDLQSFISEKWEGSCSEGLQSGECAIVKHSSPSQILSAIGVHTTPAPPLLPAGNPLVIPATALLPEGNPSATSAAPFVPTGNPLATSTPPLPCALQDIQLSLYQSSPASILKDSHLSDSGSGVPDVPIDCSNSSLTIPQRSESGSATTMSEPAQSSLTHGNPSLYPDGNPSLPSTSETDPSPASQPSLSRLDAGASSSPCQPDDYFSQCFSSTNLVPVSTVISMFEAKIKLKGKGIDASNVGRLGVLLARCSFFGDDVLQVSTLNGKGNRHGLDPTYVRITSVRDPQATFFGHDQGSVQLYNPTEGRTGSERLPEA